MKWLNSVFTKTINQYLALDPEMRFKLQPLNGKIMQLEIKGFNYIYQIEFQQDTITLTQDPSLIPNTLIRAAPITLIHLVLNKEARKKLMGEIEIEGDLDFIMQVIHIMDEMEIDWEEYFSRWVGDIPAYHTGRLFTGIKKITRRFGQTFKRQLNEYIHEEIHWFPPVEALQDFYNDIDELSMATDRLSAKIDLLANRVRDES